MSETIKNTSVCILIGILSAGVSHWLKSPYLATFLETNLILLLIALLAINTTTMSVIMTKLQELSSKPSDFKNTTGELKTSIIEQVVLIILSVMVLVAKKSEVIAAHLQHSNFIFDVLLLAVFFYAIHILYDTANGVFVIINYERQDDDK